MIATKRHKSHISDCVEALRSRQRGFRPDYCFWSHRMSCKDINLKKMATTLQIEKNGEQSRRSVSSHFTSPSKQTNDHPTSQQVAARSPQTKRSKAKAAERVRITTALLPHLNPHHESFPFAAILLLNMCLMFCQPLSHNMRNNFQRKKGSTLL